MRNFLIMSICCTILSIISQRREESLHGKRYTEREQVFFIAMVCYMIIFAGLRTHFNDTDSYIYNFTEVTKFPDILTELEWALGKNPGFWMFMSIIKSFTSNVHVFIMMCSAVALYPTVWFIRKHTVNLPLSVFIFFTLGYYAFTLAAIKQTIATAIALIAIDHLLRGKRIFFVLFILLAMTFHPYCLLYFLAPLLLKQVPWRKGTWLFILITLIGAYSFNFLMEVILDVTDVLGDNYDANAFVGEGVNIVRVMVYFVPVVISFVWRKTFFEESSEKDNLFMNFTIVCALIMFIGLFGNANMFARLAMFFEPMIYITLPWMMVKLKGRLSGMFISFGAHTAFPLYFYYQMVIAADFARAYGSITFAQFFNTLFN